MESALPARIDPRTLLGPKLWRGLEQAQIKAEPTGYTELDRVLPGGGWPLGAVSEVLHARLGVGELSLALPLIARLTQAKRNVALVAPPCLPYAPRFAAAGVRLEHLSVIEAANAIDALWSAELLLRAGAGCVLLWAARCETQSLRRLQLAAESGDACLLLLRPDAHAAESTPSALRIRVWREQGAPCVEVLKCRGQRPAPVQIVKHAA
ncbi:MAG: translesion DNA synthesis-associated protein ImuA [Panacagrimonas sp.]